MYFLCIHTRLKARVYTEKIQVTRGIFHVIKNWIIVQCNSRVLIGVAAMVYEPLYHAREVATMNCFLVALEKEISKAYHYYLIVFN